MNINDVGYYVTIGEPVVDAKGVADSGLSFPCKAIPDGDYLVTLEVNGTAIAGRDKATFASGSATVGDYTLSYSSYAVSVATLTDDDVVVLRIEPLEAKVSDAFRAVVGKAAPAADGGSGGGNIEVVKVTFTHVDGSYVVECDKTLADIIALIGAGKTVIAYCEDVSNEYFGTPTFLWPYYNDDGIEAVGGTTDISYGAGGMNEFAFYLSADGNSVDVFSWVKMTQ